MLDEMERIDVAFQRWHESMQELEATLSAAAPPEHVALALRAVGAAQELLLRELRGMVERSRLAVRHLANQVEIAMEDRGDRIWKRLDEVAARFVALERRIIAVEDREVERER